MTERIRIGRAELFRPEVDAAIARERQLRGRPIPPPAPVSPLRALLSNPLFCLPLAGLVATLLAWSLIEPGFQDLARVGGEVILVNTDPVEFLEFKAVAEVGSAVGITVGSKEVLLFTEATRLEPGPGGEAPFGHWSEIQPGAVIEASGEALDENRMVALGVRPASPEHAERTGQVIRSRAGIGALLFPLTAALITIALLFAEGLLSRNWVRMVERVFLGTLLTVVFAFLGYVPAGLALGAGELVLNSQPGFFTADNMPPLLLILYAACRSVAWACIGAALGVGMNLVRSTRAQLRNSVIGGALGGALGGVFFDPIDRFLAAGTVFHEASVSRLVGLLAVGVSVGFFVALVEQLAREAWIRVRTGPLAGKSFVLYRTPTRLGSSPRADIYLFKDADIDPTHATIHRVGNRYEIEDLGSRTGTLVGRQAVFRRRLASGDTIVLGSTVLAFEERARPGRHA